MGITVQNQNAAGFSKTAGTTLQINCGVGPVEIGGVLVMIVVCDNPASVTAPTLTFDPPAGGTAQTWTLRSGPVGSGVTTTAGSGIWAWVYTCAVTSRINNAATVGIINFSASVVARAFSIAILNGATETLRGSAVSGTSTTGVPTATTTTAPAAGDAVIGLACSENSTLLTTDTDTLNGSWGTMYGSGTTGGSANTNVVAASQTKIVTAGGNQTFNPVGGALDSVAFILTIADSAAAPAASRPRNIRTGNQAQVRASTW